MMNYLKLIEHEIDESIGVKKSLKKNKNLILEIADKCLNCFKRGNKIVLFGNGGSAADAQHIAAELVGYFSHQVKRKSLPAIALTTNSSVLTAISNDISFDHIFSRQVESLVNNGDVVIGISTSGRSKNVINGILSAKKRGAITVVLTGKNTTKLTKTADISLKVQSTNTQRIQESHILIGHIVCGLIEQKMGKI